MHVEVSTDSRVPGHAEAIEKVTEVVESGLSRFESRLTRVEVHLSDINGARRGVDRRCLIEARAASQKPSVVDHVAETDAEAVRGAVDKMSRLLTSLFERQAEHRGPSASGERT